MRKPWIALIVGALLLGLLATGCGDSGDDSSASAGNSASATSGDSTTGEESATEGGTPSEESVSGEPGELSTDEFIAEAEKICKASKKKLESEIVAAYSAKNAKSLTFSKIVKKTVIPGLQARVEAIEALGLPEDDEDGAEAMLDGMRQTNEEIEANPSQEELPTEAADRAVKEYGAAACNLTWL